MNDLTEGGTLEGETRGETILHWMVECPETERLAEADISARAAPFATFCSQRLTVKNCSFGRREMDVSKNVSNLRPS